MNQEEKKQRRLKHLCSEHGCPGAIPGAEFNLDKRLELFKSFDKISLQTPRIKEEIELLTLFKELGYSDKQAHLFWFKIYLERRKIKSLYSKMPKAPRKDNGKIINRGSGSSGKGPNVRFPKKHRKNAFKRFWQLFPMYDGCYTFNEFIQKKSNPKED